MKSVVLSLLLCALLAFVSANEQSSSSTISVSLFSGSNSYWVAIAVQNAKVDTASIQLKDTASGASYASMDYNNGWRFWTYTTPSGAGFQFPLSFVLTSVDGGQIVVDNVNLGVDTIDTGVQYSSSSSTATVTTTTQAPSAAARAKSHSTTTTTTTAPKKSSTTTTKAPTTTTTKAPSKTTTTTTKAPSKTTTTTTKAPSKTTTTTTKAASTSTASPSSATGCSAPIKLLVPLYTYPGASWDSVAAGAANVQTVAIINPNSGPGTGPDSSYDTYMAKLQAAGVEMIGYVHTSYGARAIADVKADIDLYASEFPLLVGIFLDEAADTAAEVSYYSELYTYIMSLPGYKYDVINPGTVPTEGYLAVSTQIVSFEDTAAAFASSADPSFASCSNKDQFSVIAYAASSTSTMESVLATAKSKGYYGWVYVTDGAAGGSTYNVLASYYATQASYIGSTIN